MKTLYLIRHAKSSWDNPLFTDKERPLLTRGKKDALIMGIWMKSKHIKIDLILTSPAKRAYSTAKRIAGQLNYNKSNIKKEEDLYFNGTGKMLEVIRKTPGNMDSICLVSHNPDITLLANQFKGDPILNVPTCGVLKIDFNTDNWKEIGVLNGVNKFFEFPKKHR